MSLVKELIKGLLPEEEGKKSIGVFGGGFKPPTKGHFEVLKKALDENPEIDEMLVFIGKGERDGITQEESLKIWEIYGRYLPFKVQYIKSTKPPIQLIYNTAKENPESEVLWIIGAREENEDDFKDIASRTSGITKYPNLELRTIVTKGGVSGTAARNAAKVSKEKLDDFLPEFLSEKEKQDIFVMLSNTVTENDPEDGKAAPYGSGYNSINENASYSQHIDIKKEIGNLIKHMLDKGMNIQPLPKLVFKNGDSENAKQFLGKTAYYDPNSMSIVLYTEGRHPKDIVRSFSHEMVHHTQNLEGRLGDVSTTNTMEDDHLDKLEQEANLTGTMTFRNWTDSLNESFYLDIPKFSQPKTLQHYLIENINEISLSKENAVDINGDLTGGTFTVGDITYEYSIKNIPNPYKDLGLFYNIQFTPSGEVTSIPKGGKENYIKILSTIYKIIVDFIEKEKPEYVGISSLDNSGDKNYHTVYNRLTTNNLNLIPGYFRKDSNLTFDSPQGKGRFIVLKKKDDLNEKKTKDPFGINAYAMELGRLREEETEYKIYVDMDGVVADFDQRFRDLAGIGPREFEEKYGKNAFWDFIDEGDNKLVFWVGIPPMSDAKQLIDYVSKYDYEMLTAPSLKKQSLMGKGLWMKNQTNKGLFPSKPKVNYRSAKSKKDFAAPNHILIDDREDTINSWNAAGGIGILHTSAANTINQLKKLGL
jgi:hypothetical protein